MQQNIPQTTNSEPATNVALKLTDVTYYYKTYDEQGNAMQSVGVEGVNLEVKQGSFVALVGHNGSGKSTLAKLFNGLILPQRGDVSVFGLTTSKRENIFEIRKNVGMVFQNPDNQMVASIVEEDVAFGPENLAVPQKEIVKRVNDALQTVGMHEFAKRSPHALSGGQKQRIAIAGALAIQPKVLVLDESTAMLDPQGRKEVLSVAKQLNKQGMTIILITHFAEEVLDCDNVCVMKDGHLIAQGTPNQIFGNAELLKQVGLRAPRTIELSTMLKNIGMDVNPFESNPVTLGGAVCQKLNK